MSRGISDSTRNLFIVAFKQPNRADLWRLIPIPDLHTRGSLQNEVAYHESRKRSKEAQGD